MKKRENKQKTNTTCALDTFCKYFFVCDLTVVFLYKVREWFLFDIYIFLCFILKYFLII